MRLCLDEHYSPRIATQLRERDHDVISVQAEAELRGLTDADLLAFCRRERRALVSENAADFIPLVQRLAERGDDHSGLVFSSPASMPRGAATIGLFVEALDRLLRDHPADGALRNQVCWLRAPS